MNRPGYLTTEFWLALVAQALPLLVTTGVIAPGDVNTLEGALTRIINSAAALLAAAWVLVSYIKSRTEVKKKTNLLTSAEILAPVRGVGT